MTHILVLNAGSGSQKCSLYRVAHPLPEQAPAPVWKAGLSETAPGQSDDTLIAKIVVGNVTSDHPIPRRATTQDRLQQLLRLLWDGPHAVVDGPDAITAVGHRVVHGGPRFHQAQLVTADVEAEIERCALFAPLHNPAHLVGICVARQVFGQGTHQIAVFDTSFHRTLPQAAATYPGPASWWDEGIRRYGFHGTSYRWASRRAAALLQRQDDPDLRLILAHLGGGCSLAATCGGRSLDTTMGFTPLDGIVMCTRPGALDPGILLHLLRQGQSVDDLEATLNKRSGLAGLSGLPGDTRLILPAAREGDAAAQLALDVFVHRLCAGIGQMLAALGGPPDALVFTDAIGETEPLLRARACAPFAFLGLELDPGLNEASPRDADIATPSSRIRALIIASQEDWQVAVETFESMPQ